jgi:adenine-specific DNA methylase
LRYALLDFIADFSNWRASVDPHFLETARALTQAAHDGLGGLPGTRPLVVDPFAGGGAIPLEALRVGADAFASDLNPVAVLLNRIALMYIPKYGRQLAREVRKWGDWIKERAEFELRAFYPKDPDGATPIAYLWARTITCEGPGCGAQVPLLRSLWLAKGSSSVALRLIPRSEEKRVDFEIVKGANAKDIPEGTVRRGSATCPVCGYTTSVDATCRQLKDRRGGSADARLFAVVTTRPGQQGRFYRLPTDLDLRAVRKAVEELERRKAEYQGALSLVPDEPLPPQGTLGFRVQRYGMEQWGDLFSPRQMLTLTTLSRLVREVGEKLANEHTRDLSRAVQSILACAVDREAEHSSSLCRWNSSGQKMQATFGRQALPMLWDYCEANPFGGSVGSWDSMMKVVLIPFETVLSVEHGGQVARSSAVISPLPDDSAKCFFTDPPYYDAVPYADLSDFFYVWLKRSIGQREDLFADKLTPKTDECIVDPAKGKDRTYFETSMEQAMAEGRRMLSPDGIGLVVFAHKTTSAWETLIQAMINAGWTVTGSWPIDTEMGTRLRAMDSAALASSIHLVCRPRENADGSLRIDQIGDWRDVLAELPKRIHEWLPRLAHEGVVGADAIFACLGPALEIFSKYSMVQRANGERVALREYLEHIWAAVSREALLMIFEGADTAGFEADARLTAMWLWTLSSIAEGSQVATGARLSKSIGYTLDYDAARKIAQGLGAHLEHLGNLVEIKGDKARLLPVAERTQTLFGKEGVSAPRGRKPASAQISLFEVETEEGAADIGDLGAPSHGSTVLDRVHQTMLLFASGRSEALRRFLVEEGVGQEARFWRLAQALSALYPAHTDEKRWVDGVLARKKGLGF